MLEIIEFMNKHSNWEKLLTSSPYYITVKRDGEYLLLKYNQLLSDFNIPLVRECRGIIITYRDGKYKAVAIPFFKFGNYGESYCPDIDWSTAHVYEKVDGSLMKMWYDRGQWHLSTNGTIDAYKAEMDAWGKTFGEYFEYALKQFYGMTIGMIETVMDRNCTYMFELVGPQNRLIVEYEEPCVYFLGVRNNLTHKEYEPLLDGLSIFIRVPHIYNLTSIEECLEAAAAMSRNEEGFVVCDANFNRIKIKSPEYLLAAHLHNNGVITPRRIIRMLMDEQVDDFLAYCPQYKEDVNEIIAAIKTFVEAMEAEKDAAYPYFNLNAKEFWSSIDSFKYKDFLTRCHKNRALTARDYIKNNLEGRGVDWLLNRLEGYDGS